MAHLIHHFFRLPFLCLLLILAACSEEVQQQSTDCSYSADQTFQMRYYAEWSAPDSVNIILHYFYKQDFNNPVQPYSGLRAKVSRSFAPQGPWTEVWTDVKMYYRDTLKVYSPQTDQLSYYKVDLDYQCNGVTKPLLHDYMIATICPYSPPDEWMKGAEFTAGNSLLDYCGETIVSPDGRTLGIQCDLGLVLYDLATGGQDSSTAFMPNVWQGCLRWKNNLIYHYDFSGIRAKNVISNQELITNIPAGFGAMLPGMDGTAILLDELTISGCIYDFKTSTVVRTIIIDTTLFINIATNWIKSYSSSPSYIHYAFRTGVLVLSMFEIRVNTSNILVFNDDLTTGFDIEPFKGMNRNASFPSEYLINDFYNNYHEVVWINDDLLLVWTSWSGNRELWAYSISHKRYWQVTGFTPKGLEGNYNERSDTYVIGSLNCTYDASRNKILLFLMAGGNQYAARFIDPPR